LLTTLYQLQRLYSADGKVILNGKSGGIWKMVVAYFKVVLDTRLTTK